MPKKILVNMVFIPILVAPSWAGTFQVTPQISLRQEYNDNILLSVSNELDDFITTVSPKVDFSSTTERLDFSLQSRLDAVGYADNDELNAFDTGHNARINYRMTPLLTVSGSADYAKDSRPDRDVEVTGLALSSGSREKQRYSVGADYVFTEKFQAGVSAFYGRDDFSDSGLVDSKQGGFGLGAVYDLSGYITKAKGRSNFTYTRYDFTSSVSRNYLWTVGLVRNFGERLELSVDAGPRYSRSALNGQTGDEWGAVGELAMDWQIDETSRLKFKLSREEQEVSGGSGTAERTSVVGRINRWFSDEMRGSLAAEYRVNKSELTISSAATDQTFFSISPSLQYNFNQQFALESTYRFVTIKDDAPLSGSNVSERNLLYLRLNYSYPLFD